MNLQKFQRLAFASFPLSVQFLRPPDVALAECRGWNFHTPFFHIVWNLKVGSVTDAASLFGTEAASWADSNKFNAFRAH